MAFASFKLLVANGAVRGDCEDQVVDCCFAFPVFRECFVTDNCIFLIGNELERTGADRVQVNIFRGACFHHLVSIFSRQNRCEVHGHVGDERCFRTVQHEFDGLIVNLDDVLDQIAHRHRVEVLVTAARYTMIRVLGVKLTHEGEDHVISIEITGRGEVFGGVEFHAFTQVEGIFQTISRNVPAGRKTRNDGGGTALELYETVEDLTRRCIEGRTCSVKLRVEAFRATFRAIYQGFCRSGSRSSKCGGCKQACTKCHFDEIRFH